MKQNFEIKSCRMQVTCRLISWCQCEFRIPSFSHSPRLSPAQYSLNSAESWPKTPFIHSIRCTVLHHYHSKTRTHTLTHTHTHTPSYTLTLTYIFIRKFTNVDFAICTSGVISSSKKTALSKLSIHIVA